LRLNFNKCDSSIKKALLDQMLLPWRENAVVPPQKLTQYLLSETHPVGKAKARFFRLVGFTREDFHTLQEQFIKIAQTEPVLEVITTSFGIKYIVDGDIHSPTGKIVRIRTVWIIEKETNVPRFITAYPV